jgi:hypothetical protein
MGKRSYLSAQEICICITIAATSHGKGATNSNYVKVLIQYLLYARPVLRIPVHSRILIFIHPGSRIKQQHQKRGKYFCPTIFCSHKYHEIVNNFIFEQVKKFFFAKNGIRDPRSGIWKKPVSDPGSKRHRIPDSDPDPQHCARQHNALIQNRPTQNQYRYHYKNIWF